MAALGLDGQSYIPCGKGLDAVFKVLGIDPRKLKTEQYYDDNQHYVVQINDVTVEFVISACDKLHFRPTVMKLLYGSLSGYNQQINNKVLSIPEVPYYELCNYAVMPTNDDLNANNRARLTHAVNKARSIARADLQTLRSIYITFEEELRSNKDAKKKEPIKYIKMRLFTASEISDGMIRVKLSEEFRSYLSKLPLRVFNPQLLSIPAKRPYEFQIGYKLISNYFSRQAITQHHRDCLSVTTLLNGSTLPTRQDVKDKKKSWRDSNKGGLKIPFEASLDELVECGVISSWTYEVGHNQISHRFFLDFYSWTTAKIRYTI